MNTTTTVSPAGRVAIDGRAALRGRRHRLRVPLVAAGVGLVALAVVVFGFVAARVSDRVAVLQVARPVAAGHTLSGGDLRLVTAARESAMLGRSVAMPLAAGMLLTERAVGDAAWPPAGQMTGAVSLKPGRFPADVAQGQQVTVFVRPISSPSGQGTGNATQAPAQVGAVVVAVQPQADGQGGAVVTLLMSAADATTVAAAADDGVVVMRGGRPS